MRVRTPLVPLVALPVAGLALSGCAKKIDSGDLEKKISDNIAQQVGGQKPKVDCPSGKDAKKGNTFTCTATLAGQKATIQVRLTSNDGKFTFQVKQ